MKKASSINESVIHKRPIRKIIKFIVLIPIVLTAVTAMLFLFIITPPGEGLLRRLAEKRIGAETGWELRIGTLETNLIGYVRVRDVVLFDAVSVNADTLLVVEEAAVDYRLVHLLGKRPTLASVMIDGLRNDPVFINRLSSLSGGEETDQPVWLRVNHVEIRNSELAYADSNIPFDVILGGFQTRVVRDADSYVCRVMMDSVSVRFEEHVFSGRFDAAGRVDADLFVADSLCLRLEGLEMDGSGSIGLSADTPILTFSLEFQADPSRLLLYFPHGLFR